MGLDSSKAHTVVWMKIEQARAARKCVYAKDIWAASAVTVLFLEESKDRNIHFNIHLKAKPQGSYFLGFGSC